MTKPVRPPAHPLTSAPIGRMGAADRIIEDLRDRIARGEIPRGARLPSARDVAEQYGVSAPTASEAIRGLAAMGLVEIRHGSGSYVTADAGSMVTIALATALQIEGVSIAEIIGLMALINERAAALAAERAEPQDIDRIAAAEDDIMNGSSAAAILDAVERFLVGLTTAAHEPILSLIGTFLARMLTRLETDIFPADDGFWRDMTSRLHDERQQIVRALRRSNAGQAQRAVRRYHDLAVGRLRDEPVGREARLSDPRFARTVSQLIAQQP